MGIFALGLGLVFLVVGLVSLRRGRIFAGGRLTRSKLTGNAVRLIAVPQAIAGGLSVVVGAADMIGYSTIGQYSSACITLLVATYLITNFGIGGFIQAKSGIEEMRESQKPRE